MATYVLVHGAYSGGYVFRRVKRLLEADGHEVFAPTLTGIGDRVHLASAQVSLRTHIEDVVNLVRYWDLREIVLLGYSLGGVVITGAVDQLAERIAHLVYLDALLPGDGESADSLNMRAPRPSGIGAPWAQEPLSREAEDPLESAFLAERRTAQPFGTLTETVHLARPLEEYPFSRTYIKATGEARPAPGEQGAALWAAGDKVRDSPQWHYVEIATNHLVPSNRPEELAELLRSCAAT